MATASHKAYVTDGDLGSGEFNSPEWHRCTVAQLTDEEIVAYISEAFGVDIEGTDIRAKALEVIDGYREDSG